MYKYLVSLEPHLWHEGFVPKSGWKRLSSPRPSRIDELVQTPSSTVLGGPNSKAMPRVQRGGGPQSGDAYQELETMEMVEEAQPKWLSMDLILMVPKDSVCLIFSWLLSLFLGKTQALRR